MDEATNIKLESLSGYMYFYITSELLINIEFGLALAEKYTKKYPKLSNIEIMDSKSHQVQKSI